MNRTTKHVLYWVFTTMSTLLTTKEDSQKQGFSDNENYLFIDSFSSEERAKEVAAYVEKQFNGQRGENEDIERLINSIVAAYWEHDLPKGEVLVDVMLYWLTEDKKFQISKLDDFDHTKIDQEIEEVAVFASEEKANEVANFLLDKAEMDNSNVMSLIYSYRGGTLHESFKEWFFYIEKPTEKPTKKVVVLTLLNDSKHLSNSFYCEDDEYSAESYKDYLREHIGYWLRECQELTIQYQGKITIIPYQILCKSFVTLKIIEING